MRAKLGTLIAETIAAADKALMQVESLDFFTLDLHCLVTIDYILGFFND